MPPMKGRLFGRMPERGDIVIVTPPGTRTDYIKRVIGLPGDTLRMVDGQLYHQRPAGEAPGAERRDMVPIDINSPCGSSTTRRSTTSACRAPDGKLYCRVPVVRETLPNGRSYETVELGRSSEDNFGPVTVPAGHVWLMGDNRDDSADSRVPEWQGGLGGPVPWENIGGRAEFITFSLDGIDRMVEPADLDRGAPPGPRRNVAQEQLMASKPADRPSRMSSGPVRRSSAIPSSAAKLPRPRCGSAWRWRSSGSSSSPSRCC